MNRKQTTWVLASVVVIIIALVVGIVLGKTGGNNNEAEPGHDHSAHSHAASTDSGQSAGQAVATDKVTIANYAFSPATITVKVGTTVTWTNTDSVHHTVTADNGQGPQSDLFGKGESYSYTFTKAGTYTYHCEPHPYMHGTVIVTN